MNTDKHIQSKLNEFLGEEKFNRFCHALLNTDKLKFWQEKELIEFSEFIGSSVSTDLLYWQKLLKEFVVNESLPETEVPEYIIIDSLKGEAPMQGEGTCYGHKWYFRSRWGDWSMSLSTDASIDPLDVTHEVNGYIAEEPYGDRRYDASYMLVDEARFIVVKSLNSFVSSYNLKQE